MIPGTSPPAVPRLLCWQRIVNMDDHVWPLVSKAFLSLVGQNSFWVNTEIPGAISLSVCLNLLLMSLKAKKEHISLSSEWKLQ